MPPQLKLMTIHERPNEILGHIAAVTRFAFFVAREKLRLVIEAVFAISS
jgi:hypothetical protein